MKPDEIVNYLIMISNRNIVLNMLLHVTIFISLICIFQLKDNKLRKYIVNFTALILSGSVLVNAIIGKNVFHIITFAILFFSIIYGIINTKDEFHKSEKNINTIVSLIFIIIGIWYPEFVKTNIFMYFLMSPMGIVPCPTLITILGFTNLFYNKVNKVQFFSTVFMGIVYGIIGTFRFKVYFDICLIGVVIYSIWNIVRVRRSDK